MAPRLPSVSTASGSLSRKNSRDEELMMTGQQKQQSHLSPPHRNDSTRIPLTSDYKIPAQVLNVISSSGDPSMTLIELDKNPLGDSEVSRLAHALMTNTTVQKVSLRNCKITDRAVQTLGDCLQRNATITALHLDANRITREGCASLSTALIKNETLSVLTLNRNRELGDKGVVYLMNVLEHNLTLLTLEVNDCGVQESRLKQIESILVDRQLDSAFESLLERLRDDDFRVTGIDMTGREIGDKGAMRLAEALSDNTQVRQLWLRACKIGDEGAKALASCLEQNMAIVDLYLAKNSIGDEGVTAIADALGLSNLTLVTIELDDNRVGDKGIDALTRAMERNTSVLEVTFENNSMLRHSAKLQKLQRVLKERKNGLNAVSFVVDPEADGQKAEAEKENKGIVDMSVCSSYMPSTYRRAGFNSVTDDKPVKVANKAKKVQIVAAPNVLPPPPTPNRKREPSSRRVRLSAPNTALVATNTAPSKTDNLPKTTDPAKMSPILEGSHETSPGAGTQSRSSKKCVSKADLVLVEQERKEATKPLKRHHSIVGGVANAPDASLSDPQTQRNFDDTIKTLFRRLETMLRVNHYASIHYRARHHWLCFVPISSCIGLSGLLALVNAFNISSTARLGVGLSACAFALLAFIFGFLQTRFGWSSRADIHSSTQMELSQVAFRLENLRMYQNGKLLSASLSPESRAHAIRDLYRIDVYLQAMQQCTPDPPESINEAFHLMSSRLRLMFTRYPHVVKQRFAEYGEEPTGSSSPVPVGMHVDALDLLASEIEVYSLYPILLPDPSTVVSRSIDIFFSPRVQSVAPSYASSGYDDYDEEDVDYDSVYSDEDM
eukprot:scaffold4939_cov149-Skeletonema_menzelii.AAC.13